MKVSSDLVLTQLQNAGYLRHAQALSLDGHGVTFQLDALGRARLAEDQRFISGPLHGLHRDVGDNRVDYRAIAGTFGKGSLQIVVDKNTGRAYADVDKFSPYNDVVGFLGHAFLEVVPNWFKRKRRKQDDANAA